MGRFSNLFVVCSQHAVKRVFLLMLDLRQELGVRIQHLIGSDMEPLLLGCGDSTKSSPESIRKSQSHGPRRKQLFLALHVISWHNIPKFLKVLQYPLMC